MWSSVTVQTGGGLGPAVSAVSVKNLSSTVGFTGASETVTLFWFVGWIGNPRRAGVYQTVLRSRSDHETPSFTGKMAQRARRVSLALCVQLSEAPLVGSIHRAVSQRLACLRGCVLGNRQRQELA